MGEANNRGTYEERKVQAIAEGRIKREHTWNVLSRSYNDLRIALCASKPPKWPKYEANEMFVNSQDFVYQISQHPIKQPENRKEHKCNEA